MVSALKNFLLLYFSKQFLYFLFAGGSAAFVNWSSRILLRYYLDFFSSALIAYFLGLTCAFILYRSFVFPYSDLPIKQQSVRFLLISFSFFPIVLLIFKALSELLNQLGFNTMAEPIAHAISLGSPALLTFLLYKFLAFRRKD